ncbi:Flp pilus assembly complex ATPase component TadA [bacterium]|nr:Flp pilus assembly complex ATPase component TadA [bacterium]
MTGSLSAATPLHSLSAADTALLRFLFKHGLVDADTAAAAERSACDRNQHLVEALCDDGFVDETALVTLLQRELHLPRVDPSSSADVASLTDDAILTGHLAAVVGLDDTHMLLAMTNPFDHELIRQLRFAYNVRIEPAAVALSDLRAAFSSPAPADGAEATVAVKRREDSQSPIVKMAALLIERAVTQRASDIHLEPTADGLTIRYRIDGALEEVSRVSAAVRGPLTARLKVMARLDITERRVPQDGGLTMTVAGRAIDCRVSTLPTQYGEKVVIRLLDARRALVTLDELGLEAAELATLQEVLRHSEGLILTTGPTGSGKSTTLYAMLRAIQTPALNIVTVENPIEYRLPGINQTEVRERQGMTFAAALRSILRQDPDVILIGEIRDRETAEIAIQAAQTGHLVLSTLHTNDSIGAITRLQKLGIESELIASTLLLVIAQRLVRRVCPACAEPAPAETYASLRFAAALEPGAVRRGRGCVKCRQTGYLGRIGVYELLRTTNDVRRVIEDGGSETALRDLLRRQGSRTLMQVALDKIRLGLATPEEVAAVIKADEIARCRECGAELDERSGACAACDTTPAAAAAAAVTVAAPAPAAAPPDDRVISIQAGKAIGGGALLATAVRALSSAGGLDDLAAQDLELAIAESCALAADSDASGEVHLEVEVSRQHCRVCVWDRGAPWAWPGPGARMPDVDLLSSDIGPEVRAFVIRSAVDAVSYERAGDTNRLWLTKHAADDVRRAEPA